MTGGITNIGNITGSSAAIDLTGEGAATMINQQGGTITGAILLSGLGDTVNVTGGAIAGNITGTGASGTVNFALGAGNTFTYSNAISGVAAVNVNSGTLFDNSSIAATLVSINGGALAPGQPGSPGTLSVTGSLVFASAATYMITINGANASKTNVTGAATPGGASVKVASGSTVTFGKTYTILTASGGVSGAFNPSVTFGSMTGTLTYDADDVFLTFGGGSNKITPLLPPGSPQNVLNVAGAIDNFLGSGGTLPPGFTNLFSFTPQQLVNALTQLSGEAGDRRAAERLPADELVPGAADRAGRRQRRWRRPGHAVCARARAGVPLRRRARLCVGAQGASEGRPHWTSMGGGVRRRPTAPAAIRPASAATT